MGRRPSLSELAAAHSARYGLGVRSSAAWIAGSGLSEIGVRSLRSRPYFCQLGRAQLREVRIAAGRPHGENRSGKDLEKMTIAMRYSNG